MTWPLHTLQLHDAALDFANCRPTVTTWIAQMSDSIFGDKPARIHSIYGKDGSLGHLHDTVASSADDLRAVLTQNHGGGVPIEVIDEIVAAAIQAEDRARAVAGVATAIRDLEERAVSVSRKPLREAMYFWWSNPRLQGAPKYRSKYPLTVPWSQAANSVRLARGTGLVLEHTVPFAVAANDLISRCHDRGAFVEGLLAERWVVITKQEDDAVTANGYRTALPASGNPFHRYQNAVEGELAIPS